MITDKQKQKDFEYEADYKTRSNYTYRQWGNILKSDKLEEADVEFLKIVYCSYNHCATMLQLEKTARTPMAEILTRFNAMGEKLAKANKIQPEVDFDGNEYWWFIFFWGKNLPEGVLELKLQPELTEAIGKKWPEMEEAYYAYMGNIDRSLKRTLADEDGVWLGSATLLYEKYYRNPGINADDILLMQYEVKQRTQKICGFDIEVNMISQVCNADERGHKYNYLRDQYKYYRVAFPGEFEGDRERPDPEHFDYHGYVYTLYGYMEITEIVDFLEHEYKALVDTSYIELTNANGFVRMANLLTRQSGEPWDPEDKSDAAISLRASGEDAVGTFTMISQALLKEYPGFTYYKKADWRDENGNVTNVLRDVMRIETYDYTGASISFATVTEGDAANIEIALNLPFYGDEEAMGQVIDKTGMLTLSTAAPFVVEQVETESYDMRQGVPKIKASVLFQYSEFLSMKEADIVGMMGEVIGIFASYYIDICQNYYPLPEGKEDPLAAALGSKLHVRKPADVPDVPVKYKNNLESPVADQIIATLQDYDARQAAIERGEDPDGDTGAKPVIKGNESFSGFVSTGKRSGSGSGGAAESEGAGRTSIPMNNGGEGNYAKATYVPGKPQAKKATAMAGTVVAAATFVEPDAPFVSSHPDRTDQSFRLYPKNTLIKGPMKTAKYHEAMMTAVGIIQGTDRSMVSIQPVPDILSAFKEYEQSGRIMHVSYPDIKGDGYDGFIEAIHGNCVRDGIFKDFANKCGEGRYVVLMEDVDLNWNRLFGETAVLLRENRREGTSSETTITLHRSKQKFKLPSNLYIVATCDSVVREDTIKEAINQDFYIRNVSPDPSVIRGMRVEGIDYYKLMNTLNTRLNYFLGSNYQLGEGFFLGTPDQDEFLSLQRIFREQIIPLFESWFDDDIEKIRYVLGDNAKRSTETVFYKEMRYGSHFFKGAIPEDFDTGRAIYEINEAAFSNARSYTEIYL